MIENRSANIAPRCFEYPTCGNQSSLFSAKQSPTVFLDIETTGLEIGNQSIIEIGACKVDEDGKEYIFQEFIKPTQEISSKITSITGITNEMVKHAPPLKNVLELFTEFCADATVVAHNAQFDVPWLLSCYKRLNIPTKSSQVVCTLEWAKKRSEPRRSLGVLSKKYQIGHENAHRALADAMVTKSLFFIYKNDSTDDPPQQSIDRFNEIANQVISQYPNFSQP